MPAAATLINRIAVAGGSGAAHRASEQNPKNAASTMSLILTSYVAPVRPPVLIPR